MSSFEEKNQIIDENLKHNDILISNALEKRVSHIADKAEMIIGLSREESRKIYEKEFAVKGVRTHFISENKKYLSSVYECLNGFDKLNCIDSLYPETENEVEELENDTVFSTDIVSYLRNPLADIAFNNFSKLLKEPRVAYGESFSDVCEDVYYGRTPYCILPIENSDDGRMTGFCNMIRKYGLKIVLTCKVDSANGKSTGFALLKRDIAKIECKSGISDGEYVEFGFNFGEKIRLQEVLQAASFFGFSLHRVDSFPIYYSEKEYYFDVIFKGNGDLKKFLFWIELEIPRFEIIGLYTQIKITKNKRGG